jgi:hypothetical protein
MEYLVKDSADSVGSPLMSRKLKIDQIKVGKELERFY